MVAGAVGNQANFVGSFFLQGIIDAAEAVILSKNILQLVRRNHVSMSFLDTLGHLFMEGVDHLLVGQLLEEGFGRSSILSAVRE